VDMFFP